MLFNLLVPSKTILLCFFFLSSYPANPVVIENARLKLALITPTGAPIAVANDAIEMLPVATDKAINDYLNTQKKQYTY